jgi:hypothetical protein
MSRRGDGSHISARLRSSSQCSRSARRAAKPDYKCARLSTPHVVRLGPDVDNDVINPIWLTVLVSTLYR